MYDNNHKKKIQVKTSKKFSGDFHKKIVAVDNVKPKPSISNHKPITTPKTSWGSVSTWYDSHLEKDKDTYHEKVILPNLLRLLGDVKGKNILDLACGQGYFSREIRKLSATVVGIDISKELIALAQIKNKDDKNKIEFFATPSDDLFMIKDKTQDIVVCVLAIQNIEKVAETIKECARVLKPHGKMYLIMNHPSFRIPQSSDWGYDEENNIQYRRIDHYLSESKIKIDMTPGSKTAKQYTISFHRPLQYYFKVLKKNNFAVTLLEEWESHKKSEKGKRQDAENKARKEIPLFIAIEALQY